MKKFLPFLFMAMRVTDSDFLYFMFDVMGCSIQSSAEQKQNSSKIPFSGFPQSKRKSDFICDDKPCLWKYVILISLPSEYKFFSLKWCKKKKGHLPFQVCQRLCFCLHSTSISNQETSVCVQRQSHSRLNKGQCKNIHLTLATQEFCE